MSEPRDVSGTTDRAEKTDAPGKTDWRDTVFLPRTDFPMKAGLAQKEPAILARWEAEGLYGQVRAARAGRDKFILHDGPPYANGDIHVGHALNHVLKDMVVRTQTLLGKDAPYVPGWDCHGLPIEWKVEEQYRKKKLDKDQVPPAEFRAECRAYAAHWVDVQREQLKRLGIGGDWANPYLTMDFSSEATIVGELLKFAESGQLYRGAKPVMWSPVEKTALADAEVEYEDVVSTQVDVAFEIVEAPNAPELVGAYAVIWTTTPWTLPVNQAIAYGPDVEYLLLRFDAVDDPLVVLVAKDLAKPFGDRIGHSVVYKLGGESGTVTAIRSIMGRDLAGTIARHPLHARDDFFARPRPFLPGDFVTTDAGTGLVHMAPDHGEDDFALCHAHGIAPVFAVEADGRYRADWAWLGGEGSVINPKFNAPHGPVCEDLRDAGALLAASDDYRHSYPHSWRSKAKVIYRCTPQWFVPMDRELGEAGARVLRQAQDERVSEVGSPASAARPERSSPSSVQAEQTIPNPVRLEPVEGHAPTLTLRQTALAAIADTRFVPDKGRNRIGAMVAQRPDWVLSRQRAWGVPITLFVDRRTGRYLVDAAVNARIVAAVREHGVDAWSDANAQTLLGDAYDAADYERVTDILDVWFDSGSTHAFVLDSGRWPDLRWPADLYLEGSDQHRGWFQSSLLESCGTRGRAPYDAVLTHGFTMDAKGLKMSKSLGNTVSPLKVIEQYGADIVRLWALSVDYTEDHRIGDEILKGVADQYRKLRNTFRYLLGALDGFTDAERVDDVGAMPELERYVLALLARLDATLRAAVAAYDFNTYVRALIDFCNEDLSAFYFDIRKDCLYCDALTDPKRRAYRTVLDTLFHELVRYAAPVLVFTAEEVWGTRFPEDGSVHLLEATPLAEITVGASGLREDDEFAKAFAERVKQRSPSTSPSQDLIERWAILRTLRVGVMEAIEPLRREKTIRSGLEAAVAVPNGELAGFDDIALAELFIVASVRQASVGSASVSRTSDHKCSRCWRHLPEVAESAQHLCDRCTKVVGVREVAA